MFDPREYLEVIGLQDQDVLDLLQDHNLDDADAYVKLEEVKMPLQVVSAPSQTCSCFSFFGKPSFKFDCVPHF